MALNNLTGQNIQDTYQRVVQTDRTNLADGTGSLLPISFNGNDVIISGSLTAHQYIVSSSVTNITIATLSGSTTFGNSTDDTHTFTGNITSSANISASGYLTAQNITASNNISASGNIYSDELWLNDKLRIYNNTVGQRISGSGEIFFASNKFEFNDVNISLESPPEFMRINGDTNILGNITSSANISASGYLIAQNITASANISASGTITANNINGTINGGTF
jgi:uncharacterized protein YfiM (DUF2279 family)